MQGFTDVDKTTNCHWTVCAFGVFAAKNISQNKSNNINIISLRLRICTEKDCEPELYLLKADKIDLQASTLTLSFWKRSRKGRNFDRENS